MATEKQLEANRRNAQKSTGPRTEEGKAKARFNALTHGFRTNEIDVLPNEDPAEYQARVDAWLDHYEPTDAVEDLLVRQIADLSWKRDRAARFEAASLSKKVRGAVEQAENARQTRVFEAACRLLPTIQEVERDGYAEEPPSALLEIVLGSAEGCRRMIDRWKYLRDALRIDPFWLSEFEMEAIRLSGVGPGRIADPEVLDFVVANRVLKADGAYIDPFHTLEGPLGLILDQQEVREACLRQPEGTDQAKAAIVAAANRAIARL